MKKFIGMSAVLACFILSPLMANAENGQNELNAIRKANGRALIEMKSVNWQSVLPYYTYDIEYHDPIVTIQGMETMAQFLGRMFGSSSDLVTVVEDENCDDDIYAATWTMTGTFNGYPYTAKGMTIIKFRPGEVQAYYQRDYYTEGDIMINVPGGLDQAAGMFRTYYRCFVDPTFVCPLQ